MKSSLAAAMAGLAICLPCLLPLLIVGGLATGAFSAVGAALAQPWLAALAAAGAALLLGAAAAVALYRRARPACEPSAERSVTEGM